MYILKKILRWIGALLAHFLTKPTHIHDASPSIHSVELLALLKPGDVILVEGNTRISTAIKYLTQSTWSHAALFVGSHLAESGGNPSHLFIEADIVEGVRSVSVDEFSGMNLRICRPVGLDDADCRKVTSYAIAQLGNQYDLKNVFDLARYLLPTPPVPLQMRRKMLAIGSGDPTRAICSTLVAQAFQSIRYPILPIINIYDKNSPDCPKCKEEILSIRHHSLFAPRDFDLSPYFLIIKPKLTASFNHRQLHWLD